MRTADSPKETPADRGTRMPRQVGQLRSALMDTVTPDAVRAVAAKFVEMARDGDVRAIKELLDRTLGKPLEADLIERLERLEELWRRTIPVTVQTRVAVLERKAGVVGPCRLCDGRGSFEQ